MAGLHDLNGSIDDIKLLEKRKYILQGQVNTLHANIIELKNQAKEAEALTIEKQDVLVKLTKDYAKLVENYAIQLQKFEEINKL